MDLRVGGSLCFPIYIIIKVVMVFFELRDGRRHDEGGAGMVRFTKCFVSAFCGPLEVGWGLVTISDPWNSSLHHFQVEQKILCISLVSPVFLHSRWAHYNSVEPLPAWVSELLHGVEPCPTPTPKSPQWTCGKNGTRAFIMSSHWKCGDVGYCSRI